MNIEIATWILAGFTAALVWVTWRLAKHTESLARLTGQIVHIEEERENRTHRDQESREISKALQLAERLLEIDPDDFASALMLPGQFPQEEAGCVRAFALVVEHSLDSGLVNDTNYLLAMVDKASRNPLSIADSSESDIRKALQNIQANLPESMDTWRNKLTSPIMSS